MSLRVPVFWDYTDLVYRDGNVWTIIAAGGGGGAHATSHENGGADEINVAGLSGVLADPQTPASHATSHENGGADEINVAGLSGQLADAQKVGVRGDSGATTYTYPRINFVAGTYTTVSVTEDIPNNEVVVTFEGAPSGGGGSLTNGTATLNFGAAPGTNTATVDVTTPIAAGNLAMANLMYEASADHNAEEHALLAGYVGLTAYRSAVNTLTIVARTELRLTGEVAVRWAWSA